MTTLFLANRSSTPQCSGLHLWVYNTPFMHAPQTKRTRRGSWARKRKHPLLMRQTGLPFITTRATTHSSLTDRHSLQRTRSCGAFLQHFFLYFPASHRYLQSHHFSSAILLRNRVFRRGTKPLVESCPPVPIPIPLSFPTGVIKRRGQEPINPLQCAERMRNNVNMSSPFLTCCVGGSVIRSNANSKHPVKPRMSCAIKMSRP